MLEFREYGTVPNIVLSRGVTFARGMIAFPFKVLDWLVHGVPFSVKFVRRLRVTLSSAASIGAGTVFNVNHADTAAGEGAIQIGRASVIGRNNFFSSGNQIAIGDYVLTAPCVSFISASHSVADMSVPMCASSVTKGDSISVGENCFFGYGSSVIGNVKVGYGSVVAAFSVVRTDVPPFSLVVGSEGRVIKRYSFLRRLWVPVRDYDENVDMVDVVTYREMLRSYKVTGLLPYTALGGLLSDRL